MPRQIQCVAPLKEPKPLNSALLTVLTVFRHGARAPIDSWARKNESGTWICDSPDAIAPDYEPDSNRKFRRYHKVIDTTPFPPNCDSGSLIIEGMQQLKELGAYFRSYYVDKLKFIQPNFDPFEIFIRSSRSPRCQTSLRSFLQGLFPESPRSEIITYLTGAGANEPLNPDPYTCKDMVDAYAEFISTPSYKARANVSLALQKPLYEYLNLTADDQNWMWLGDWMYSFVCSNQPIPSIVTDEMFDVAMNDTLYYSGGFAEQYPDIMSGGSFRTLFEHIDAVLSEKRRSKFGIFSAHDSTVTAIMTKLGHPFKVDIPPYRSYITFEIYKDLNVRVLFNGEPVTIDGQEVIRLSKLRAKVVDTFSKCTF
ncbi:Histidine acid phosphatase family protein [Trichomonas vaginalis G3]|uniref:Histidine acid phosphatase family protein n=1 Tax=Trichomonas vaginalis (strain ATCC PRA-98 / G3) TaxID=412133 RepID=A2DRA4_TRIV3|nr:histidine acid phosphatase [Trichomonas vaginalis G3]EAY17030.1 Histidine acid phosphatase family protein [Trichomonas vaginalis G3]KAI5517893.1 acid phosphatase protein [Trichomonas vaginalis G3]|eukprot:XP_001329253.1 histidine acid phosphatase [Trichomonas vaginalis G3]